MGTTNLSKFKNNLYRCTRCGSCKGWDSLKITSCPIKVASAGFLSETPRGMMIIAREIYEGKLKYSKGVAEILARCTVCGSCTMLCNAFDHETGEPLIDPCKTMIGMKADVVEEGIVPAKVGEYLENIYKYGNPYGESRKKRNQFAQGVEINQYKPDNQFLYFVGCVGSYDTRGQEIARTFGALLVDAGVSFGILGDEESCDGNEVNNLGERGLFSELAKKNIQTFKNKQVKSIVTLSPHAYNAIKNEYPKLGGNFEVLHYTQFLLDLIKNKKLTLAKGFEAKVVYHDPCFLGRHNKEYDAPREILSSIQGISLIEMKRNRDQAFCCGGGGGNFYTDILGGEENSPSRIGVREAYDTGASVLAVACPTCMIMFEDAIKAEGLENKLTVKDISEIVRQAC